MLRKIFALAALSTTVLSPAHALTLADMASIAVPEPETCALMFSGLATLGLLHRRRT